MRRLVVAVVACSLVAFSLSAAAEVVARAPLAPAAAAPLLARDLEAPAKQAAFARIAARLGVAKSDSWAPLLAPSEIDVLHYRLDLVLDVDREVVAGTVEVELAATVDDLATVRLDADQALAIRSVTLVDEAALPYDAPLELAFTHADDVLVVSLPHPLTSGASVRLLLAYGGPAGRQGEGVNWDGSGAGAVITTFAEPFGSRLWWPCNDRPDDKATVELHVTAPDRLVVAANGLETARVSNGDGTATSTWASRYPVATYLVVMNVANFAYSESSYHAADGTTMPVVIYAYPQIMARAEANLAITPTMIEVLAEHFGEYPFIAEKYGNVTTPFGGGMEHQTLTSISAGAVEQGEVDYLNVHELGHQWWGDWVTNDDWRELWLNEGFASYCEWLWAEHIGPAELAEVKEYHDWYGYFTGAVYDNPVAFSDTVYSKGAWVLNMLRFVVGDEVFFPALADYRARYGGGSATSEGLREVFEEASGRDLEQFFAQWVYGENRPRYQYEWTAAPGPAVSLTLRQKQTNAALFAMPLEVAVTTAAGVETVRVESAALAEQVLLIPVSATPLAVTLDPDRELLAEIAAATEPDLELGPDYPGPFRAPVTRTGQTAALTVPMTNVGGADLVVHSIGLYSGASFRLTAPTAFPLTIAPGATVPLALEFRPTGLGAAADYVFIDSSDPSHGGSAMIELRGTGALTPTPYLTIAPAIGFGRVPVGGVEQGTQALANLGGADLNLTATIEGDGFALGSPLPAVLAPGGRTQLVVRFTPERVGTVQGRVVLTTNDPAHATVVVSLTGEGLAAPRLGVSPARLALGIGDGSRRQTLTLANLGQATLEIVGVEVADPFSLSAPTVPASLAPGESTSLEVAVAAAAAGPTRGLVRILSNDPGAPLAVIPVEAWAVEDEPSQLALAAAARTSGVGTSDWSTDLVLVNPTTDDLAVDLAFHGSDGQPDQAPDLSLSVAAGTQRRVADLVSAAGCAGSGGFALTTSSSDLVAESRTFTASAAGTYGQRIPVTGSELGPGQEAIIAGLASGDFRTNLGVLNLGDAPLTVDVALVAADGGHLGDLPFELAAGAFLQRSRVLGWLDDANLRGAYARVVSNTPGARYLAYASVVDDLSNDPSFIAAVPIPSGPSDLVIPVVTSGPGSQGTLWSSELTVVNPGETDALVRLEYPSAGFIYGIQLTVAAGTAVHVADVVSGIVVAGTYWLHLSSDTPGLVAHSRTYTTSATGTYGQSIPAVASASLAGAGDVLVLPGLVSGDGFRSNLLVTSASAVPITVSLELMAEDGSPVGALDVEVAAAGLTQLNRFLESVPGWPGHGWARVTSATPGASYFAAVSVVDELTGDPVFVPAAPVGGP